MLESEGDWYRVEFDDPQFGRRVGYIQKTQVRVLPPDYSQLPTVDLTVAEARRTEPASQARMPTQTRALSGSVYPATETSIGWGLLRDFSIDRTSTLGWGLSVAGNLSPWIGVVGDIGGNYKTLAEEFGVKAKGNVHAFLGGIRFTGRLHGGLANPFGQFTVGLVYSSIGIGAGGLSVSASSNDFAIQPGGGVDVARSDAVAVRFEVDVRTIFSEGETFNEFRFVPGIVIRSGRKTF